MPHFYSGYQIYEANDITNQYKFYNFLNMTNQDAAGLYPQFMYEAILKKATGNPDFNFKVRSTPFPSTNALKERKTGTDAGSIIFTCAITYSMILTTICGFCVAERVNRLKHIQVISGVQLGAYWTANFVIDYLRMMFSVAVTLACFAMAGFNWTSAWVTFCLFPFGTIPFTYVTSFMFSGEASAATVTIFINFASITLVPSLLFYLRWLREIELIADTINMILRCFPAYNLGASIFFNALNENLAEYREATDGTGYDISVNPWDIT
jgi:ATP-binding cassette, subfamily A (ABC1), member 3